MASRTTIYLVRHAKAGNRKQYRGDDLLRPLSPIGRRQADAIAGRLGSGSSAAAIDRIITSPALRCVATVAPLADRLALRLGVRDWLREGTPPVEAFVALLRIAEDSGGAVVACTHGDVIWALLDMLETAGLDLGSLAVAPKASTWELTVTDGMVTAARLEQAP